MESGSLKQRNVVGVITGIEILTSSSSILNSSTFITGLMGSGKTTLLHHLFGMAPPKLYTSTGVANQSLRGFLHHIVLKSAGAWKRLSNEDIQEVLALLIEAGMKEADVHSLASVVMRSIDRDNPVPVPATAFPLPSVPEESHTSKKIVPLIAKPPSDFKLVSTAKNLLLELVHMIDTGGQPELMEVMPSLIHNADIAIVLINLEYGLDECPKISYHEKGVGYECQLSSHYTARDIILKLASTLHAKKSLHQAFRLLIVATHRDCVKGNFEAQIESLNTKLHGLLYPAFENELILSKTPRQIPFVLNLKNQEDCDEKALNKIRTDIGKQELGNTFDTPTSFFVFEQDLVQFANNTVKRRILSLDECKQVGTRLKMSGEMVEAALILFHRQNTFLYFRNILPNHIFVNPQVPLDIVNGIVCYRYKMNAGELDTFPAKFVTQLNKGIITKELLGHDKISSHFEKGFYEVQDAIKLLRHTFTLAPLQSDNQKAATHVDDKQRQYLMMCLMPAIPDQKLNDYIPKSSDTVPLVVKFSSGCVPLGCFGSTVACLISKYGWKVITKKDKFPKCLAHNIAYLHDPDIPVNVVLVDFTQYIELHIEPIHGSLVKVCSQVHSKVLGAIENVFNIMHLDTDLIKISSAVLCSICTKASEEHFAEFTNCKGKYLLRCGYEYDLPNEKQLLWMGIDAASKDPLKKPTLPLLQRFPTKSGGVIKIIDRIGTKHHDLGIRLLNDDYGTITDITEAQYKHDPPNRATEGILQKWLEGTGRTPQTWDTLITVLREIELNTLAKEIEENLLNIQVHTQKKQTPDQTQKPSPEHKEEQTSHKSQKPSPELKEEQTSHKSQKPSPELKEEQTSHKSQKPSPELKEEQTPDQSQKSSPELKEERTPDQSQKSSPELKEERTPDQSQKPSPELKEERTPDQSQKSSPELKEERTPDQSQKPSPELKEEQTPDQSQKPLPELKEEQTPDQSQKSSAATHQTERQNQYKSEPTKEQYRTTWKQVLFWSIFVVILAVLLNLLLHAVSYLFAF